jgi:hypothetical protein
MDMHIYILGCLYDENKVSSVVNFVSLLKKLLSNKATKITLILVLNNKDLLKNINVKSYDEVLVGSNENAEFGAWQEGLAFIQANDMPMDAQSKFVFFNDTVFHHFIPSFVGLLHFFNDISVNECAGIISGEVQTLPANASVLGVDLDKYICSALFYINYQALDEIGFNLLRIKASDIVDMPNSYDLLTKYFDQDILSYRIGAWLFGGGWYRSKRYQEFDASLLKLKLAMIINEKVMAAELIKRNYLFKQSLKARFDWVVLIKAIVAFCKVYGPGKLLDIVLVKRKYRQRSFKK